MKWLYQACMLAALSAAFSFTAQAQAKRKVIIDQDAAGPGGTDMQSILALVNSPDTDVLGITVLTGDAWRDEEVQHTLRLMEIIGRTDIPVVPGAAFPLVSSKEFIEKWEKLYGKLVYQGAWNFAVGHPVHGPTEIPPMPEGSPTAKAANETAANFLVRMVRKYPHQVTIYAAGPMTDLAMAIALDPQFPELSKELIVMGGSINPRTDNPEFALSPSHEFNFWMDPEASRAVLHAHWPRVVVTTVDISVKTLMGKELIEQIRAKLDARGAVCGQVCVGEFPVGRTGGGGLARPFTDHEMEKTLYGRRHRSRGRVWEYAGMEAGKPARCRRNPGGSTGRFGPGEIL